MNRPIDHIVDKSDAIIDKWEDIAKDWRNGNLVEASKRIRGLKKTELVFIFVEDRMAEYLVSNQVNRIQFQNFIEDSLHGWYGGGK